MMYLISIGLLVLNMVSVFIKKNVKLFAYIMLLFMWIVFWGNTKNPDYETYNRLYSNIQSGASVFNTSEAEIGYQILMKIGALLGLSYKMFISIVSLCCYALIHSTVKRFCTNYNYIYVLYFIFPFFLDVVQIRNFIVMSLFIYAVRYLFDNTKRSQMKYILIIFLGSLIHYSLLLFLPMILISFDSRKNLIRIISVTSVFGSLIILLNNKEIPFIKQIASFVFDSNKVLFWFDSKTNWGFLLFWFMQTCSFLIMWYTKVSIIKYYKKDINQMNDPLYIYSYDNDLRFVKLIYWINVMAFSFFPLYLMASTFTRLMRNIILLNYISFAITNKRIKNINEKVIYNTLIMVYILVFFLVELFLPYKDTIINAILQNNIVL